LQFGHLEFKLGTPKGITERSDQVDQIFGAENAELLLACFSLPKHEICNLER
jgi:hypothetical protein